MTGYWLTAKVCFPNTVRVEEENAARSMTTMFRFYCAETNIFE